MRKLESDEVYIEVIAGRAGNSLYLGDEDSGNRIAGPKPWGGGSTLYKFPVKISAVQAALDEYAKRK